MNKVITDIRNILTITAACLAMTIVPEESQAAESLEPLRFMSDEDVYGGVYIDRPDVFIFTDACGNTETKAAFLDKMIKQWPKGELQQYTSLEPLSMHRNLFSHQCTLAVEGVR